MVKCVDCGLLAARNYQTRELEELEATFRKTGEPVVRAQPLPMPEYISTLGSRHEREPLCFAQAPAFGNVAAHQRLCAPNCLAGSDDPYLVLFK